MQQLVNRLVIVLLLATLAITNSIGSSIPNNIEELIKDSEYIVTGKVIKRVSYHADKNGKKILDANAVEQQPFRIFTDISISVEENVKGKSSRTVTVNLVGGTVGQYGVDFMSQVVPSVGDKVVLFAKEKFRPSLIKDVLMYTRADVGIYMAPRMGKNIKSGLLVPYGAARNSEASGQLSMTKSEELDWATTLDEIRQLVGTSTGLGASHTDIPYFA